MPYTNDCPTQDTSDHVFRAEVLKALEAISVDIDKIDDVETLTLYDDNGVGNVTPFIRYLITDLDNNVTVLDTQIDGTTPYVTTGTVKTNLQLVVEASVLTLWDDDGAGIETPFLRIVKVFYDGIITVDDYELDASTPYVVTGTVRESITRNVNPAFDSYEITPSDVSDLPQKVDWIRAGASGTIKYTNVSGSITNVDVDKGSYIWDEIIKVFETPDRNLTPVTISGHISK